MFNVGFNSSYSMEDENLKINDENLKINDFSNDKKSYETTLKRKEVCCGKKTLLISSVATLGLIGVGTGLYFLLKDKNNNNRDIVPPIPVPKTDIFTDKITEIISDNITTDKITIDTTYIDNFTNIISSIPITDNITDIISTTIPLGPVSRISDTRRPCPSLSLSWWRSSR